MSLSVRALHLAASLLLIAACGGDDTGSTSGTGGSATGSSTSSGGSGGSGGSGVGGDAGGGGGATGGGGSGGGSALPLDGFGTLTGDCDAIDPAALVALQGQAEWLLANPSALVAIYGHADLVGSNAYNERIGLRRAAALADEDDLRVGL